MTIPERPTRHGFLLRRTEIGSYSLDDKTWTHGNSEPVMIEPWKSAFTSFACIPAAGGIAFSQCGRSCCIGGRSNPISSDIYPSHSWCNAKKESNLEAKAWSTVELQNIERDWVYFVSDRASFHRPFRFASFLLSTPAEFLSFSAARRAFLATRSFFVRLSRSGLSKRIWRPCTRDV